MTLLAKVMNRHCKNLLLIASLFGASSIIMASIGSHAAYDHLANNNLLATFEKAVDYGLYNAVVLIALAALCHLFEANRFHWSGYCIALGGFIFQTSLYFYTLTEMDWISKLTPFVGMLMISGWLLIGMLSIISRRSID